MEVKLGLSHVRDGETGGGKVGMKCREKIQRGDEVEDGTGVSGFLAAKVITLLPRMC